MELEKTSLYDDIQAIIKSGIKPVHFSWRAEIIADKKNHPAMQILNIDISQDYELNYSDEFFLTITIPLGTFVKYIYPFRDNLEVILYKVPLQEGPEIKDTGNKIQIETYTAHLLNGTDVVAEAPGINLLSVESMNLAAIPTVIFQLVNKSVEQLRLINVGGTYRNDTPGNVVKSMLTTESKRIKLTDARKTIGVTMVEPDNTNKRDHIQLPHGIPLVDMPLYVHQKCGGIYNAGLAYYYQDNYWYVYPCYNPSRFDKEQRTLTIINIPPNKFPSIERTYNKVGNSLTVLATGDSKFKDISDNVHMSEGNAVMYADSNQYMDGFVVVQNNKAISKLTDNVSEYTSEKRKNGINNSKLSGTQITSNPFLQHSILARRQGATFTFVWENSNPTLLFPGMVVKIIYHDKEIIKEMYGTLLKTQHFTRLQGQGITANRHVTNTALVVFIKAIEGKYEQE